jgi:hypothetical protein
VGTPPLFAFGSPSSGSGTAVLYFKTVQFFRATCGKLHTKIAKYHAAAGYSGIRKFFGHQWLTN